MSPLTESQIETARDLLLAAREQRIELAGLPTELTPDTPQTCSGSSWQ